MSRMRPATATIDEKEEASADDLSRLPLHVRARINPAVWAKRAVRIEAKQQDESLDRVRGRRVTEVLVNHLLQSLDQ
jgi:hypothetical protein